MTETTEIAGDLTLSRCLTTGGAARIGSTLTVLGDLRVEGWLRAPNVQGPCKGLFSEFSDLEAAFPNPYPGWWALVGKSLPAQMFSVKDGRWSTTGGTGGIETPQLDSIETRLDSISDRMQDTEDSAHGAVKRVDEIKSSLDSLTMRTASLNVTADSLSRQMETLTTDLLTTRPTGDTVTVLDRCKGLTNARPAYNRSIFSGFANVAGEVSSPFDMIEVPVLAADWEGNTTPLSSVLVAIRRGNHTGELLFSTTITFEEIKPGENRTLRLFLSGTPLAFTGSLWIEMHFNAPCTLYFCSASATPGTEIPGRYYMSGKQDLNDAGLEPTNKDTWWWMLYRLLLSGGATLTLNDSTLTDIADRLGIEEIARRDDRMPMLRVPERLYAVAGDTLQLFYRGMIEDILVEQHRPMIQCDLGTDRVRYWEYTPPPSTTSRSAKDLTMALRDCRGETAVAARCTLVTLPQPKSPSAPLHVVCIGDSLTAPGVWPREVRRRLCATGGSPAAHALKNVVFCGETSADDTGWTGHSGWLWHNYTSRNGTENASTGIVTPNPLYDPETEKMSFLPFARTYCNGKIDVVYVLLGWNNMGQIRETADTVMQHVLLFARTLHKEFPAARLRLMGVQMPSPHGGCGASYGSAGGGYADTVTLTRQAHTLNRAYAAMAKESEFAGWTEYVEVAAQFDSDNSMPGSEMKVNTRSSVTEKRDTNGVHPATEGYLQIADAVYRNLCAILQ